MKFKPASIEVIKVIAKALEELNEKAVFIGGATVPFYLPEAYVNQARPTEDIDIVMEVIGQLGGGTNDEALRAKGFKNDTSEGAPICRWNYSTFKVDILSSDVSTVGFTNKWYEEGIKNSIEVLKAPVSVKIFSLPYFIASKLVAFQGRGHRDYMGSHDMEDIISVIEVAEEKHLEDKLLGTSKELRQFLKSEFEKLIKNSHFIDAIPGAIFNRGSNEAIKYVVNRMKNIINELD